MDESQVVGSSNGEPHSDFFEEIQDKSFPSAKERGNEEYYNKEFEKAIEHWLRAYRSCKYILSKKVYAATPEKENEIRILKMQLDTNLSIAYLKLKEFQSSIYYAEQALEYNPKNIKALHHKAEALFALCEYKACIDCANSALEIEPENTIFRRIKYNASLKQKQYIHKTKKMGELLFNNQVKATYKEEDQSIITRLVPSSLINIRKVIERSKYMETILGIISRICPLRSYIRSGKKKEH